MKDDFKIAGEIHDVENIGVGRQIRELPVLQKRFGRERWRKLKALRMSFLAMAEYVWPKFIGMKLMVLVK